MLQRILTGVALLPILAVVYFAPAWVFFLLALAAGLACAHEAIRLFQAKGRRPLRAAVFAGVVLVFGALAWPVPWGGNAHLPLGAAVAIAAGLAFGLSMLLRPVDDAIDDVASTIAIVVFPGLALAFQVALRNLGPEHGLSPPALLLFLFAAVFGNDAAAYFTGRFLGRLKLAPSISPKKTVEGFVGGLLGGVALALGVKAALGPLRLGALGWGRAATFAALLAAAAVLGDLAKSSWKRSAGVKDSGHLLPGHGGVLDRLDGLMFSSPLLWLLVTATPPPGAP